MAKVKGLVVSANPEAAAHLSVDKEMREIREKVRQSSQRAGFELVACPAARPDDLLQALNEHKPHVVHFSGHGTKAGEIVLIGRDEQPKTVSRRR